MECAPDLRNRHGKTNGYVSRATTTSSDKISDGIEDTSRLISVLDILRVILTVCAASCALSYYITSGESVLWGYRPWFTRPELVRAHFSGPLNLTPLELSRYGGQDPKLPVYLSINGTIFDVSAGRQTYGPGGSYSVFAGRDATRAFVTGCFDSSGWTHDLRGAEEMYIPIDTPETEEEDSKLTSGEKKTRREQERREARKKVNAEVQKWEDFYRKSKKYFEVGKVVKRPEPSGSAPVLCEQAMKSKPKRRKAHGKKAEPAPVHPWD